MKYIGTGFLAGIIGFVVVAFLGYFLISLFSANRHDRSVEASMTSIFVFGPIGFILFFIIGYIWAKNSL
ncbi:hypothetical protein [Spirosoma aerophilum]